MILLFRRTIYPVELVYDPKSFIVTNSLDILSPDKMWSVV